MHPKGSTKFSFKFFKALFVMKIQMKWLFFLFLGTLWKQDYAAEMTDPLFGSPQEDFELSSIEDEQPSNLTLGGPRRRQVFKYLQSEEIKQQLIDLSHDYKPAEVLHIYDYQVSSESILIFVFIKKVTIIFFILFS